MIPYQKTFSVITLNGTVYPFTLEVWSSDYNDPNIRTELSTTIPEVDRLRLHLRTNVDLNKNRINTNNLVNANEYTGPTEPLAIKLYRQEYNLGNDRWDAVVIPQDVRNVQTQVNPNGFTEFQCTQWSEQGVIDVFPIQSYLSNSNGVSSHIPYWNNANYKIDINFNDLLDTYCIYTDGAMEYMGVYDNTHNYIVGDYVKIFDDPQVERSNWLAITSYTTGQYALVNGLLYIALQGSINRPPDQETLYWRAAGSYYRCVHQTTDWNPTKLYAKGDVSTFLSTKYKCIQDSTNNQPDINDSFWEPLEITEPYHLTLTDTYFWERSDKEVLTIHFLTNEFPISVMSQHDNFSMYANNPIFKLNHLKWMSDIQEIFNDNSIYDYKFTPVKLNADNTYVSETDSMNNEIMLRFNISQKLQKLYMNQYIPDYVPFFASLESEKDWNESLNHEVMKDAKISILRRSNLVNSFVKGLEKGIKEIYGLYCRILGSYTFVIEKSPIHPNHVYRITSTLPKLYWINHIKPVVHPLGWYEEYKEIKLDIKLPIINIPPPIDPYDPYTLNHRNYFYKFKSLILQMKSVGVSYLTVNSKPPFNKDTRFYDLIAIDDLNTTSKFNWKYNVYNDREICQLCGYQKSRHQVNTLNCTTGSAFIPNQFYLQILINEYTNQELMDELDNPVHLKLFMKRNTSNEFMIDLQMEYRYTGIGTKYVWELWRRNVLEQTVETHTNYFKSQVPYNWYGDDIKIRVRLLNDSIVTDSNTRSTFDYMVPFRTVQITSTTLNRWI